MYPLMNNEQNSHPGSRIFIRNGNYIELITNDYLSTNSKLIYYN